MIRAAFRVTKAEKNDDGNPNVVTLMAICDREGKYADYFAATPAGDIKLALLNDAAFAQFVPGRDFYVDFNKVEE